MSDSVRTSMESSLVKNIDEAVDQAARVESNSNNNQAYLEDVLNHFLTNLNADKMKVMCKTFVDKFLRNSYKPQRHNRFSDSVDNRDPTVGKRFNDSLDNKDSRMLIQAGHVQLKESGLEELMKDDKGASPKFSIEDLTKPKKFQLPLNENNPNSGNLNSSIQSKRFLQVGNHTGVPDIDLSMSKAGARNAHSISKGQFDQQNKSQDGGDYNIMPSKISNNIYISESKQQSQNRDSSSEIRNMKQNNR